MSVLTLLSISALSLFDSAQGANRGGADVILPTSDVDPCQYRKKLKALDVERWGDTSTAT
jgi:hypothetical protein